jgi:hypothetical protein
MAFIASKIAPRQTHLSRKPEFYVPQPTTSGLPKALAAEGILLDNSKLPSYVRSPQPLLKGVVLIASQLVPYIANENRSNISHLRTI